MKHAITPVTLLCGLISVCWPMAGITQSPNQPKRDDGAKLVKPTLLDPIIQRAMRIKTLAMLKDFQIGIKTYQVEYNRFPMVKVDVSGACETKGAIVQVLMGENIEGQNPRQIAFIELPENKDGKGGKVGQGADISAVDPWGTPLRLAMDTDQDNEVNDPEHPGQKIKTSVIAWSAGPDKDFATWEDNVASWKP